MPIASEPRALSACGSGVRLEEAYNALVETTMAMAQLGKSSGFLIPILNASPYLDVFGDVVLGHFLLQSAALAEGKLRKIYEVIHQYQYRKTLMLKSFLISFVSQMLFFTSLGVAAMSIGSGASTLRANSSTINFASRGKGRSTAHDNLYKPRPAEAPA